MCRNKREKGCYQKERSTYQNGKSISYKGKGAPLRFEQGQLSEVKWALIRGRKGILI